MRSGLIKVHAERCMACKRCVMACAVAHSESQDLLGTITERPPPRPKVTLHVVRGVVVPTQCRHCEAAACVLVCPTGALSKAQPGEPVRFDAALCIGCRSCVISCPWGAPEASPGGGRIDKCDLCCDRLDAGIVPACAQACPTGCLEFVCGEPEPGSCSHVAWRAPGEVDPPGGRRGDRVHGHHSECG